MTATKQLLPPYGQPAAWDAPTGVRVWGARWIYPDDMVYNRQGFNDVEDDGALQAWLNAPVRQRGSHPIELAMEEAKRLNGEAKLGPSMKDVVTLYEDEKGIIRGNPNASYGYLYVAAWLK